MSRAFGSEGAAWLIVTSPENFELSSRRDFTVIGLKKRHRRKVERMRPGDLLVFYLIREGVFAGACRVTSSMFEDHERIWFAPGKPGEDYPWRVRTTPLVMPPAGRRPEAESLRTRLDFVRKWPAAHWRLAFQGMVHALSRQDGRLLLESLQPVAGPADSKADGRTRVAQSGARRRSQPRGDLKCRKLSN